MSVTPFAQRCLQIYHSVAMLKHTLTAVVGQLGSRYFCCSWCNKIALQRQMGNLLRLSAPQCAFNTYRDFCHNNPVGSSVLQKPGQQRLGVQQRNLHC